GQNQTFPEKRYSKNAQFKLPLQMGDADRQTLREVQLYVKHGTDSWVCVDKAPPTQAYFPFKAAEDGEYWFSIVTLDQAGKATPGDLSREPPALIVVVDTQPPHLELSALPAAAGGNVFRCEASDLNLQAGSLKVEYQTAEMTWLPLEPVTGTNDLYSLPADKAGTGLVRATVADLANNITSRELGMKAAAATHAPTVTENLAPRTEVKTEKPMEAPPKNAGATGRQLLNCAHVILDYQIDHVGPSGVGRVEVWMTKDEGKSWQRLCDDKDRVSPAEFDLPGEGVYGLSVVVTNGNGMGDPPPANGDQPDYWIEVDTTKPAAQLLTARPIQGDPSGALHITWQASDKNLGGDCVSLFYARQRDGEWVGIAKGLHNDGSYRWAVPRDVGSEFFVRMEVIDKAGNTTRCELPEKVVLDMSRPKAKVLGVAAGTPHTPTPPTGN
ncbi:MAG TPA: hypothetical protein VGG61_16300, partial [Gemmataceae bacterium]